MRNHLESPVHRSLRAVLRASTSTQHRAVDGLLSRLDLADAADYTRFLRIQLAALTSLSDAWGTSDRSDLESLIHCLHTDLGEAGALPLPYSACGGSRTPFTEAGVAYVVRGSRLGAAVLLGRVKTGSTICYLSHRPALSWPDFLRRLGNLEAAADREAIDDSIASARAAFDVFARAVAQTAPSACAGP